MKNGMAIVLFAAVFSCVCMGGLTGRYFSGTSFDPDGIILVEGLTEQFTRVDASIDYWDGTRYYRWQPIPGYGDNYTVQWTGYIEISVPGEYGFGTISDDGSQVWIDGKLVVDNGEGQWYDWEDNLTEYDAGEPNQPVMLNCGFHKIMVRFYEGPSYDGIELWWLLPGSGVSDIPYYGTTFHGTPPTYNPNTNWNKVPAAVLFTESEVNQFACRMDLNGDGVLNYYEFSVLSSQWGMSGSLSADFYVDGNVDMCDLVRLADLWLVSCIN